MKVNVDMLARTPGAETMDVNPCRFSVLRDNRADLIEQFRIVGMHEARRRLEDEPGAGEKDVCRDHASGSTYESGNDILL